MEIAVLIPSRGLIHSRTMEDVLANLKGRKARIFITHDLPIPDCFNELVRRALKTDATYFWFVEEDMKLPHDILKRMLLHDSPVVTANYPSGNGEQVVQKQNDIILSGTGCLLVQREVFERMDDDPFSTATIYQQGTLDPMPAHPHVYGGHDIDFYVQIASLGFDPVVLPMITAGQYRVEAMGTSGTNSGAHTVSELTL